MDRMLLGGHPAHLDCVLYESAPVHGICSQITCLCHHPVAQDSQWQGRKPVCPAEKRALAGLAWKSIVNNHEKLSTGMGDNVKLLNGVSKCE